MSYAELLLTINLDYPPITLVRYLPTYEVVRPSRQMACGKTLNMLSQEKRQATKIRATDSNMTCSGNARPDSIPKLFLNPLLTTNTTPI